MTMQAAWGSTPRTDLPLWRRLAVRALTQVSRWFDARAYALEFPADESLDLAVEHLELARDPVTGYSALYVNGERRFTFLQGLERL
jgi:hypothetical protein